MVVQPLFCSCLSPEQSTCNHIKRGPSQVSTHNTRCIPAVPSQYNSDITRWTQTTQTTRTILDDRLQPRFPATQPQDQLHLLLSTLTRGEDVLTEGFQDFHRFAIIKNTSVSGLELKATQELTLADVAASLAWQPQGVRRLIELRATGDPAHPRKRRTLPFDKALKILQAEFSGNFNMDDNKLPLAWRSTISPRLGTGFRTMLKASAGELAVLSGGQQVPAQPGYGGQ